MNIECNVQWEKSGLYGGQKPLRLIYLVFCRSRRSAYSFLHSHAIDQLK